MSIQSAPQSAYDLGLNLVYLVASHQAEWIFGTQAHDFLGVFRSFMADAEDFIEPDVVDLEEVAAEWQRQFGTKERAALTRVVQGLLANRDAEAAVLISHLALNAARSTGEPAIRINTIAGLTPRVAELVSRSQNWAAIIEAVSRGVSDWLGIGELVDEEQRSEIEGTPCGDLRLALRLLGRPEGGPLTTGPPRSLPRPNAPYSSHEYTFLARAVESSPAMQQIERVSAAVMESVLSRSQERQSWFLIGFYLGVLDHPEFVMLRGWEREELLGRPNPEVDGFAALRREMVSRGAVGAEDLPTVWVNDDWPAGRAWLRLLEELAHLGLELPADVRPAVDLSRNAIDDPEDMSGASERLQEWLAREATRESTDLEEPEPEPAPSPQAILAKELLEAHTWDDTVRGIINVLGGLRPGEALTEKEIEGRMTRKVGSDNTVRRAISGLRRTVEKEGLPVTIPNTRGAGYYLATREEG